MATAGAAILIATVAVAPAAAAQRPIPHTNCSAYASRDPTPGGGLSCRRGKHRHWLFVTCIQYKRGGAWHNKTCRMDQGTAPAGRFGAGIQWLGGFKESCNRSYRTATIAEVGGKAGGVTSAGFGVTCIG